jgi:hypothetical protein
MAIYFDENGNLVDTEINESSNVFMEDPTENFYQPRADISPTQDFYPQMNLSPTQDFYPPQMDISPTQDFYQPRQFVNAPQNFYPPNLTSTKNLPTLDLQSLPANMGVANEDDVEQEFLPGQNKESGIMKLIKFLIPGSSLGEFLPKSDPRAVGIRNFYRPYEGLTSTGSIASGIMKGYNPVSGGFLNMITGGKFGKPTNYGLAGAMQRRIENIIGRKAPQTDASRARISELRNLQLAEMQDRSNRGESLGSIGRSTFSGPGMAFEKQSGGVSGKGTANERNYGGR